MSHNKPLPFTKDGFRYSLGEYDEPLCSAYIKELKLVEPNKRINLPPFVTRKIVPPLVRLSDNDRAPQLKLNDECYRVTGEKGYSMIRATHGANRGKYYFEVYINSMPNNTATRIGWGQQYANLQAPLGYDCFGYSWRSRLGTKFHEAKGQTFDKNGGYKQGDTIGCMIELPYGNSKCHTTCTHLPTSIKKTNLICPAKKKDVGTRVLEEQDKPPNLSSMEPLVGSRISFYKNGLLVGVAYEDIFSGFYYPSISLYKSCTVTANFGPKFAFPPDNYNPTSKLHIHYRPAQDMAEVSIIDNLLADMIHVCSEENHESGKNILSDMIKTFLQS